VYNEKGRLGETNVRTFVSNFVQQRVKNSSKGRVFVPQRASFAAQKRGCATRMYK
jgi:hypothetical protein